MCAPNMNGMELSPFRRAMKNFKIILRERPPKETFDFSSLPPVCQRRFVEICDGQTIKTFARINASTRNLVRGCHVIDKAKIAKSSSICKWTILCYCNDDELCPDFNLSSIKSKLRMSEIKIRDSIKVLKDAHVLQTMTIICVSTERLNVKVRQMNLDELKKLITPELKSMKFIGGVESNCSSYEFLDFIKSVSKLENLNFTMISSTSSLGFNFKDLFRKIRQIGSQVVLEFQITSSTFSFKTML